MFASGISRLFAARGDAATRALSLASAPVPARREHTLRGEREVAELFGELGPGTRVGNCEIVSLHAPVAGAIPVMLATGAGRRFQLDVLRRDPDEGSSRSVSVSRSLAVYVCNGGDGSHATDEEQGLAAMALAALLERRERSGAARPALLTMRERAERFPTGVLCVRG